MGVAVAHKTQDMGCCGDMHALVGLCSDRSSSFQDGSAAAAASLLPRMEQQLLLSVECESVHKQRVLLTTWLVIGNHCGHASRVQLKLCVSHNACWLPGWAATAVGGGGWLLLSGNG